MIRYALPRIVRYCNVKKISGYGIPTKRFYYPPARCFPWNHRLSKYESYMENKMEEALHNINKSMGEYMNSRWTKFSYPMFSHLSTKEVEVVHTADKYELKIDLSTFLPEEITIKQINNRIEISAKHEEKPGEHGYISREIKRCFSLPEDVDEDSVVSVLTNGGNLILKGKIKEAEKVTETAMDIEKVEAT